jgi:hypothetical protein
MVHGGGLRCAQGKASQMEAVISGAPSQLCAAGASPATPANLSKKTWNLFQKIAQASIATFAALRLEP